VGKVEAEQRPESQVALLMVADCVFVRTVHAVGGGARGVQQLLQRGAFALEALQMLQVGSRRQRNAPKELKRVDVR
jgi:hypothetical protein